MESIAEQVATVLQAAGYAPATEDTPGFKIFTESDYGGCIVASRMPDPPRWDAYPGYRAALEQAGYQVYRHAVFSSVPGRGHLHDVWFVPTAGAPDA